MVEYAAVFGVVFLLATLVFTVWITWISLQGDTHAPALDGRPGDAE